MVTFFLDILFEFFGKERYGVTDEQVGNMLSQQIVQTLIPEELVDLIVIENLLVIVFCTGQVAVDSVVARLGDHEFVLLERLKEERYKFSSGETRVTSIVATFNTLQLICTDGGTD